jgi:hypothetical protein
MITEATARALPRQATNMYAAGWNALQRIERSADRDLQADPAIARLRETLDAFLIYLRAAETQDAERP